jgi:uncharacterized protein YecT (DUF1311 family)
MKRWMGMVLCVFLCGSLIADEKYETQAEMNARSCAELDRTNKDMDEAYNQVVAAHGSDAVFARKFKRAQQVWEDFRDAHMDAVYPQNDKELNYGSIYPTCRCVLMTELTVARVAQLKRFLEMAEGTACGY